MGERLLQVGLGDTAREAWTLKAPPYSTHAHNFAEENFEQTMQKDLPL